MTVSDELPTGSTSLLARSIIDIALARGDKVIATGRDVKKLQDLPKNDRLRVLQLDVTAKPSALKLIAKEAVQIFGRVDVLVNNAGLIDTIGPGKELGSVLCVYDEAHGTTAWI